MANEDDKNIGVSSCISGTYAPLAGDTSSVNKWSLCLNKSQSSITLSSNITTPSFMVDSNGQQLKATLNNEDIKQLLSFLFQAKAALKQAQATSPVTTAKSQSADTAGE